MSGFNTDKFFEQIAKDRPAQQSDLDALSEQCNRLQDALAFYMPDVPEVGHPLHERIARDAYLLCGYDGSGSDEPSAQALGLITLTGHATQPSERTNQDYAIEHAEYLAKAAERFIEAACSHSQAVMEHYEQDTMETAKAADDAAESTGEAMTALRSRIYEFRKRRDRAAPSADRQENSHGT